jgi:hypothetical protein
MCGRVPASRDDCGEDSTARSLRVVDTQTGSLETNVNPLGTAWQAVKDTSAFATSP